ncbi:hypothetical protein LCGC14_2941460, partial [marine sediment metagenome]
MALWFHLSNDPTVSLLRKSLPVSRPDPAAMSFNVFRKKYFNPSSTSRPSRWPTLVALAVYLVLAALMAYWGKYPAAGMWFTGATIWAFLYYSTQRRWAKRVKAEEDLRVQLAGRANVNFFSPPRHGKTASQMQALLVGHFATEAPPAILDELASRPIPHGNA